MCLLRNFLRDQRGAVNTDWVALTSSLLLLGMAIVYVIYGSGVTPVVSGVNGTLKSYGGEIHVGASPDFSDG